MNILAIFIGGIIGGTLRYILGLVIPEPNQFPLDILIINLIGSLALGSLYGIAALTQMRLWLRNGLGTGIIGSFTTFSTFCTGAISLAQSHALLALIYVLVSGGMGPLLAYAGDRMALFIGTRRKTVVEEVSA
ncbi:FluC/FEX family fluoride channel [Alicyclobacillus suci]|uniref:FluC/FEX family fluoride channel n=1 Tax=Alicyclobacillus suci TaxID=2816080 RepID=UPI001A8CC55F|nr:CrcB family protein [Alicyclobacillus suci]